MFLLVGLPQFYVNALYYNTVMKMCSLEEVRRVTGGTGRASLLFCDESHGEYTVFLEKVLRGIQDEGLLQDPAESLQVGAVLKVGRRPC